MWRVSVNRTGGRTVDRHRRGPPSFPCGPRERHDGAPGIARDLERRRIFFRPPYLHCERSGSVPPVSKHGPRSLTRTQGHAEKGGASVSAGVLSHLEQPRGPDPGKWSKICLGYNDRVRSPKRKRVVGTNRIHQVGGDGLCLPNYRTHGARSKQPVPSRPSRRDPTRSMSLGFRGFKPL